MYVCNPTTISTHSDRSATLSYAAISGLEPGNCDVHCKLDLLIFLYHDKYSTFLP